MAGVAVKIVQYMFRSAVAFVHTAPPAAAATEGLFGSLMSRLRKKKEEPAAATIAVTTPVKRAAEFSEPAARFAATEAPDSVVKELLRETLKLQATEAIDFAAPLSLDSKFAVLVECERVYRKPVPNYHLNDLKTASDVAAFFSTPAEEVVRPRDRPVFATLDGTSLPPNLTIRR